MRRLTGLFACLIFFCRISLPAVAAPVAGGSDGAVDPQLVKQLLDVINDSVITRLDARVTLDQAAVQQGRVRLQGVHLRNLNIGVLLNARGARRLADIIQKQLSPSDSQFNTLLQIAQLGLFNHIEVAIRLRELDIQQVNIDADRLDVKGLLLQVGATPPDPVTGKPRSDTLSQVLEILRHTALNRIHVHGALDALAAKRLRVFLKGTSLVGLSIGVSLKRVDSNDPANAESTGSAPVKGL